MRADESDDTLPTGPPMQAPVRDLGERLGSGATPSIARPRNERLVLALVRRHGTLSKAEIARRSGLSAQTATVITRRLEDEGLLRRGTPEKGRIGQPAVPFSLDPGGAVAFGIKVGRRSAEFMAIDLVGDTVAYERIGYGYPAPDKVLGFIGACLGGYGDRSGLTGIGVALPWQIWGWLGGSELDADAIDAMEAWRGVNIVEAIGRLADVPVLTCNDGTAATRAENAFGLGRSLADYATFYIGHFVGGGIVLGHRVFEGRTGNAGAFGTLPMGDGGQLLERASLSVLHGRLRAGGHDPLGMTDPRGDWTAIGPELDRWIGESATALASASVAIGSVLDLEAIAIEGQFPPMVRERLAAAVREALRGVDTRGIEPPAILEGTIGHLARVRGAAALPLFARHFIDD